MHLNLTFWKFWDNSEDVLTSKEHFDGFPSHFGPFPHIMGSLKKMCYGPTDASKKNKIAVTSGHLCIQYIYRGKGGPRTLDWAQGLVVG